MTCVQEMILCMEVSDQVCTLGVTTHPLRKGWEANSRKYTLVATLPDFADMYFRVITPSLANGALVLRYALSCREQPSDRMLIVV